MKLSTLALLCSTTLALSACSTAPTLGDASAKTVATGAAGGASSQGANSQLEHCAKTLGSLTIIEESDQPWFAPFHTHFEMDSTVPLLRLIIQQSNCFVIVERGKAFKNMQAERELMNKGELRQTSNMGKGQMVAADYTASPSVAISARGTSGMGGMVGGFLGPIGSILGGMMNSNEASTMLLLTDNRSGIQLSAAEGSAKNWDYGVLGGLFSGGFIGASGYTKTPQAKVLTAAFMDSYNQMVKALRTYKAQEVEGGLGNGGTLKVN